MVEEIKKGEEQKKEEAPAAIPEAEKNEQAAAAEGEEKNKEEAGKEPPPPPPPPPCILGIDLHCTGCANKIKRCILRCKGVEGVEVDMAQNQVTVKGIVDPQGICERLRKRTMRNATVISPPPPPPSSEAPDAAAADKEEPVVVHSQVSEVTTVELLVNMHCEACAQQLEKKILKMRGVQTAQANSGDGKLSVSGTMSADKLVQYIHRRTGKIATVVPPPPPPEAPKEESKKEDGDHKNPEEVPAEGAGEKEQEKPPAEDAGEKKDAEGEKKEQETAKPEDGAENKEGGGNEEKTKPQLLAVDGFPPEEMMKRMMYWSYPHKHYYDPRVDEEAMMPRKMAMAHPYAMPMMQWTPPPPPPPPPAPVAHPIMYQYYNYGTVERPAPAPQYFSDENPNACVIS